MPTVPSLDPSGLVTPSQAPGFQGQSAASAGLLDQGAQQISAAGDALGRASDAASQIFVDAQTRFNQTTFDDSRNQVAASTLRTLHDPNSGFLNKLGAAATTPDANGTMPGDAALQKVSDAAQAERAKLTNPEQLRMFDEWYGGYQNQIRSQVLQHEGQQTRQYSLDTNKGTIELAANAAVQDYASPDLLDQHIQSAQNAAYKNSQVMGQQGPALVAAVTDAGSQTIRAGWQAAIENGDIATAAAIQKRYGSILSADDAVHIDGTMKTAVDQQAATTAAHNAMAPNVLASTPSGQAFAANIQVESNGKQTNADGTPVTSSKGAIGIAQVMPDTAEETAKKHGIPWDPQRFRTDPAYNAALGQTYWSDQLQANNGDVAKADAAYNAGPGGLQTAMQHAQAAGAPQTWQQYLPSETQEYLQKVSAARASGAGAIQTKADVYARIDGMSLTPQARALAYTQADKLFSAQQEAITQQHAAALSQAQTTLLQNGGDMAGVSPLVISAMDPKDVPGLTEYAGKIRQGGTTTNEALYADIVTHMEKYTALSDQQWYAITRPNLSAVDFKTLTAQRADALNAVPSNGPGNVNLSALNATLDQRLTTMGLDPHPPMNGPHADTDMASRVDAIRSLVTQNVYEAQRQANRKFSQDEVAKQIDLTLLQTAPTEHWSLFGGTQTGNTAVATMTADDIPAAVNNRILADFRTLGVLNPTSGQRLGLYWHMQNAAAKAGLVAAQK